MGYSKGDTVVYKGHIYQVEDVTEVPSYWVGPAEYNIRPYGGGDLLIGVEEFSLASYYIAPKRKEANPCECGAHATFMPTSHSPWCPMFGRT